MRTTTIPLPMLGAIAATRVILGVGAGLLLSSAIPYHRRRQVGFTLLGIGLATTVPLAMRVIGGARRERQLAAGS